MITGHFLHEHLGEIMCGHSNVTLKELQDLKDHATKFVRDYPDLRKTWIHHIRHGLGLNPKEISDEKTEAYIKKRLSVHDTLFELYSWVANELKNVPDLEIKEKPETIFTNGDEKINE